MRYKLTIVPTPRDPGPLTDQYVASVMSHAIARAREPIPGEGMWMRRTRGNRPVLVISTPESDVAYAVHGAEDWHGGLRFDVRQPHVLRRHHG